MSFLFGLAIGFAAAWFSHDFIADTIAKVRKDKK